MSSIDKYVVDEAKKCSSRVQVTNYNGTITGTINGEVVFRISDRHGFLSEYERNTIQSGINSYTRREEERRRREEAERRERERRERERIENERKAAKANAEAAVSNSFSRLDRAYAAAKRSAQEVEKKYAFSVEIAKLDGFSITEYKQRAADLERRISNGVRALDGERDKKQSELNRIRSRLSVCSTAADYYAITSAVNAARVDVMSTDLCVSEAEKFKAEVAQLKQILNGLNNLKDKLNKINPAGAAGVTVKNALKAIAETKISSVADAQSIVASVQNQLVSISNLQYQERVKGNADEAAALSGALDACTQLAEIAHVSSFAPKRRDDEILKVVQRVYSAFKALDEAEYTTCTAERRMQVFERVQAAGMGAGGEESTLESFKKLLEEGEVYARNDRLLRDKYEEYKKLRLEYEELGGDISKIEAFDANNYERQRKSINALLLEMDLDGARSQSALTYAAACAAMEEQGYQMVRCDMSQNGLAFEAVYALPRKGRETVACHLVVSEGNIRRRICGIVREDGMRSSEEAVLQAAADAEKSGEINDFFGRYRQYGGTVSQIVTAVDAESENAIDAILAGYIELDGREGAVFDRITGSADKSAVEKGKEPEKKVWSYKPKDSAFKCGGTGEMDRQAQRCQQNYQRKRAS